MLNGYLDFIEDTKWEPFIGIGIGTPEIDVEDICVGQLIQIVLIVFLLLG